MLVAAFAVLASADAHAAWTKQTLDGIEFGWDDAAPAGAREATVVSYSGGGGAVVIPDAVDLPIAGGGTASYTVTTVGTAAFSKAGLTSVTLPAGLRTIELAAFMNNDLRSVSLPSGLVSIGDRAFADNALETLTLPEGVAALGEGTFQRNALTSVSLPSTIVTLPLSVFEDNSLTDIDIPAGVAEIQDFAFDNNALESVVLHEGLDAIGWGAFSGNRLTSLEIPASVTRIWSYAFQNNVALREVTFLGPAPVIEPTTREWSSTGSFDDAVALRFDPSQLAENGGTVTRPTWMGYDIAVVGAPRTPQIVSVELGDASVTVEWAPSDATPVVDYVIELSIDGGSSWMTYEDEVSSDTRLTLTALDETLFYEMRLIAVNEVGASLPAFTQWGWATSVPEDTSSAQSESPPELADTGASAEFTIWGVAAGALFVVLGLVAVTSERTRRVTARG